MRRAENIVIFVVASAVAIFICGFLGLSWYVQTPHSPDLTPAMAETIIAQRPEFNAERTLVGVSSTTRGEDSLNTCCYRADFVFNANGSEVQVRATGDFRYWEDSWHLTSFDYDEPKKRRLVWINSDAPHYRH